MALDAGIISSIISGATNLTSTFVGFGASIYAVNHQQGPMADENTYNIMLPKPAADDTGNLAMIATVIVLMIVLLLIGFVVFKYSK